jgi:thioredoxin 1
MHYGDLFMPAQVITEETFDSEVLDSETPVLVDFWGDDCVKCAALSPVMDRLADEWDGQVKVAKMWLHPEMPLVSAYRIMGIPTMILFQDGEPVARSSTALTRQAVIEAFEPHLPHMAR